ncbi:hypothetical protein BJ742DRAFT_279123 [Cladochytrium replicatum]|nr:hypothetical protein BJ742DRAFT_279123 [Cladochytrium replicatum]
MIGYRRSLECRMMNFPLFQFLFYADSNNVNHYFSGYFLILFSFSNTDMWDLSYFGLFCFCGRRSTFVFLMSGIVPCSILMTQSILLDKSVWCLKGLLVYSGSDSVTQSTFFKTNLPLFIPVQKRNERIRQRSRIGWLALVPALANGVPHMHNNHTTGTIFHTDPSFDN